MTKGKTGLILQDCSYICVIFGFQIGFFYTDENSPSLVELYLDVDITSFTEENKVVSYSVL